MQSRNFRRIANRGWGEGEGRYDFSSRNPRHFCELRDMMRRPRPCPIRFCPTLIPRVHSADRNFSRRLHRSRSAFPARVPPSTRLQSRLLVIFLSASRRQGILPIGKFALCLVAQRFSKLKKIPRVRCILFVFFLFLSTRNAKSPSNCLKSRH